MDTIDQAAMEAATEFVRFQCQARPVIFQTIHTVTITLNGQHGGMDVTLYGEDRWGEDLTMTGALSA